MNSALLELEFDQLVIFLARTAIRAGPIWRHVFPLGARRDARIGIAERLVVDMTADQAHVFLHQSVGLCVGVKSNSTKFIQAGARRRSRRFTRRNRRAIRRTTVFAMPPPAEQAADFPPIVLAFAASDPSGGAGIQADILTLASMGCHPLSVLTAITVQDTMGVEGVQALDAEWVADQARCLLEDMPVDAFKIGVLGSVENIAAIAEILADYPDVPLVLDPVLASGRGDELASDEMLHALRELLLPQTTILTPNSLEARRLADTEDDDPSLSTCAQRLIEIGSEFVLITGTHEATPQ